MSADPSSSTSDASPSTPSGDTIQINIKAPGDAKLSVSISLAKTVMELKQAVAEQTSPRVEPENQRLIYSGRVLKDEQTLSEYKIQSGHSIHMVKGCSSSTTNLLVRPSPTNFASGQQVAGNPLAPLMNATNHIPAGFNPFADMGVNTNDPNFALSMLDSPQVQENMARMLDDPAVLEQIIASDPRLQAMGPQVRDMLRSPMMRQMLMNPQMMRQAREMMGGMGGAGMGGAGGGVPFPPPGAFGTPPAGTGPGTTAPGATGGLQQDSHPLSTRSRLWVAEVPVDQAEILAFMNSPMGQMAMQQMMGGGGMGGMGGLGGALGGGSPSPAAPADGRSPEERFEVQLGQLQGMGFTNARQNILALQATGGNVEAAIEYILTGNQ